MLWLRIKNPGKKSQQSGVSLLELVVTLGILSMMVVIAGQFMLFLGKKDVETRRKAEVDQMLHIVTEVLNYSANSLSPRSFHTTMTYAGIGFRSLRNYINGKPLNDSITFVHGKDTYSIPRGSTNLEIASSKLKMDRSNHGVLLARCVLIQDRQKTNWTVRDVLRLNLHPVPSVLSNGEFGISCCRLGEETPSRCQSLSQKYGYRSRVFKITKDAIRMIPPPATESPIIGAGFFLAMDHRRDPSYLANMAFIVDNECLYNLDYKISEQKGSCPQSKFVSRQESFPLEKHFYDSGYINMGH